MVQNAVHNKSQIPSTDLKGAYEALKLEQPKLRIFDAAKKLGVSEAALLCTDCGGAVLRLKGAPTHILTELEAIGEVMALTRNEWAVIEKVGVYRNVELGPHHALVLDENIDLRVFTKQWAHAFAVEVPSRGRILQSIQIFDAQGNAIHKIYLKDGGDPKKWQALVESLTDENQSHDFEAAPAPAPAVYKDLDGEQAKAFAADWSKMTDTHQFFGLLRRYGVHRHNALNYAPEGMTQKVKNSDFVKVMEKACENEVPIMVFVGNKGTIEIHSGPVKKLVQMDNWFNVMDPKFNLHLRTDAIESVWIVRKPTEDGIVTSLELYDSAGETIAMLFGARKPGIPELETWRQVVEHIQ